MLIYSELLFFHPLNHVKFMNNCDLVRKPKSIKPLSKKISIPELGAQKAWVLCFFRLKFRF